jgi:hypothetical protein
MKRLILAFAIMVSTLSFAQTGEKEKMTPQQRIDKQLKEMTTSLNLSEKQQGEVKAVLTEQANKRAKKREEMKAAKDRGEKPSDEQRAEMKKNMIDEQLAMKTKMKKILSEDQQKKLREIRKEKGHKMHEKRKNRKTGIKKEAK